MTDGAPRHWLGIALSVLAATAVIYLGGAAWLATFVGFEKAVALGVLPFLLGSRPLFVDFDLCGMLSNFLFSGHYELPAAHTQLRDWYPRIQSAKHGVS